MAVCECSIFLRHISEASKSFAASFVSLEVFWEMISPEVIDSVKLVVVFKVELGAHVRLGKSILIILPAVLLGDAFELSGSQHSELRENTSLKIVLYSSSGIDKLKCILLIGLVLSLVVDEVVQRLLGFVMEVMKRYYLHLPLGILDCYLTLNHTLSQPPLGEMGLLL